MKKQRWTTAELEEMIIDSYLKCDDRVARENPEFQTWVKEVRQPQLMLDYMCRAGAKPNLLHLLEGIDYEFE
jgi:hypothetical protein